MAISFTSTYQGIKLTSLDTFSVPSGRSTILSFKVFTPLLNPTSIHIIGFLYSFEDESTPKWDMGAYAILGSFAFLIMLIDLAKSIKGIQAPSA